MKQTRDLDRSLEKIHRDIERLDGRTEKARQGRVKEDITQQQGALASYRELRFPREMALRTWKNPLRAVVQRGQRFKVLEPASRDFWDKEALSQEAKDKAEVMAERLALVEQTNLMVLDDVLGEHPRRDEILAVMEDRHQPEAELGGMPFEATRETTDRRRTWKEPQYQGGYVEREGKLCWDIKVPSYLGEIADQAVLFMFRFSRVWRSGFNPEAFRRHCEREANRRAVHGLNLKPKPVKRGERVEVTADMASVLAGFKAHQTEA